MRCEICKSDIDGSFGTGRFCNRSCAAKFSTRINRDERNRKISLSLRKQPEIKQCKKCMKGFIPGKTGTAIYCNEHRQWRRGELKDIINVAVG